MATYKSNSAWWVGGTLLFSVLIILVGSFFASKPSAPVATVGDPTTLAGIQSGTAPWAAELGSLFQRLKAIGLPALSEEGVALHIHQHLDIFVGGNTVPVPAGVGINQISRFISPVHVHDNSGIIHVESPKVQTFTLGQFFDIWGVRFTGTCIGEYCRDQNKTLKVFVNGQVYSEDPRQLALEAHQEIVIAYGTLEELPKSIPSTYSFPSGE